MGTQGSLGIAGLELEGELQGDRVCFVHNCVYPLTGLVSGWFANNMLANGTESKISLGHTPLTPLSLPPPI